MKKEKKENLTVAENLETQDNDVVSGNNSEESTEKSAKTQPADSKARKKRRWLPYVITTAVLAAITLLVAWAEHGYTRTAIWLMLDCWGSSVAIAGVVGLSVGALVWASNGGVFDIFAYGGRIFVRMFFKKDVKDHKYPTYYDYRESRKDKKRAFWYMLIVGGAYFTVGAVLLIVGSQLH